MEARVLMVAALAGLALTACDPLPRPDYVDVKQPASYRVEANGTRIDNANYKLDNQGYRLDDQGERVGIIDVPEKTEGDASNAVAGYYISTTGQMAPGRVASTSDIVPTVTNEPLPSQMPQQTPITPTPGNVAPPPGYGTPKN